MSDAVARRRERLAARVVSTNGVSGRPFLARALAGDAFPRTHPRVAGAAQDGPLIERPSMKFAVYHA